MFSHSWGRNNTRPNATRIPPEIYPQTYGGMAIKAVDALRRYVKSRIESAREPMTMNGVALLRAPTLLPITTGKSGKIHGASTVSTPAMNETMSSVID